MKWIVLLISSYFFYFLLSSVWTVFILFTTATVFISAIAIERITEHSTEYLNKNKELMDEEQVKAYKAKTKRIKKYTLLCGLFANLGILIFLKYGKFLFENINLSTTHIASLNWIILPVGISFYTFQALGYLIDVYRGKYKADHNFFKFSLFLSFFLQIIQGPISRYDELALQLYKPHRFYYARAQNGILLMLWGYFKKLVIADRAALYTSMVFENYIEYAGIEIILAAILYTLQIYGDFSGGIDIIRGIAQILGIDMALNFKRPFFARTVSEFWRRWHISLGSWTKDYIFYPLILSKGFARFRKQMGNALGHYLGKTIPVCVSTIILFLVIGIWHGASWNYVFYGLCNGGIISLGLLLEPVFDKVIKITRLNTGSRAWSVFQMIRTFVVLSIVRMIVNAKSLSAGFSMLVSIGRDWGNMNALKKAIIASGMGKWGAVVLFTAALVMLLVEVLQENGIHIRESISRQNVIVRWITYYGLIFAILFFMMDSSDGIKEFIYAQF